MPRERTLSLVESHFRLKKPCVNCPFLVSGAIDIGPERLSEIIASLLGDDTTTFQCHKTVHNGNTGGDWDDEGNYHASGHEAMCAGAMIYLEKANRPSVTMRLGHVWQAYKPQLLLPYHHLVISP